MAPQWSLEDLENNNSLESYLSYDSNSRVLEISGFHFDSGQGDFYMTRFIEKHSADSYSKIIFRNISFYGASSYSYAFGADLCLKNCTFEKTVKVRLQASRVEFIGCNLSSVENLILDTKFIVVTDSTLPITRVDQNLRLLKTEGRVNFKQISGIEAFLSSDLAPVIYFSQFTEISIDKEVAFRILNNLALKNSDNTQAHLFHNKLLEVSPLGWEDRWLRRFSGVTNDHGRSWVRPLLGMWIVNVLAIGILNYHQFADLTVLDRAVLSLNVNPLASFVNGEGLEHWSTNVDVIRRIVLAALTYQLIVAARRFAFVKK